MVLSLQWTFFIPFAGVFGAVQIHPLLQRNLSIS